MAASSSAPQEIFGSANSAGGDLSPDPSTIYERPRENYGEALDGSSSSSLDGGIIMESAMKGGGKNCGGGVGSSLGEQIIENEGAVNEDKKHDSGRDVEDTPRNHASTESAVTGHENHNAGVVGFPLRTASTNEVRRWIAAWLQSRALSHDFLEPSLANVAWNGEYMYEASAERMQWELAHWGFGNVYGQMIVRDILKERSRDEIPLIHRVKPTRRNICDILAALIIIGIIGAFTVIIGSALYFFTLRALFEIRNITQG